MIALASLLFLVVILAALRKPKPIEVLVFEKPWRGGVAADASLTHVGVLELAVLRVAHRGARLRVEQEPRTGKWRAWLDAPQFELATVRGEWKTRPGALRMILRELGPLGGLWLSLAVERQSEREAS